MDNLLGAAVVMFEGATKFPLIAIPLFVLAGAIMNTTGISRRLIAFASACLGFIRGGLSMATSAPRCSSPRSPARRSRTSRRSARF